MREDQGNVALVFPVGDTNKRATEEKKIRTQRPLRSGLPVGEKMLYLVSIILCVVMASMVLTRYAKVTELNVQIQETEASIEQTDKVNLQMETEKQKLSNEERIRQFAEEHGLERKETKTLTPIGP